MKSKHVLNIIFFICIYAYSMTAYAFDDRKTHPELTEASINTSSLNSYLKTNIGFSEGYETECNGVDCNGYNKKLKILRWLQEGSTDEDHPLCRAQNHFHNPIHTGDWTQSQMTDSVQ